MSEPRRILCPVDFSKSSELALRYALSIARDRDAEVVVLHVVVDVVATGYPYMPDSLAPTDEMRTTALEQLETLVQGSNPGEVTVDVQLAEGDVVDTIVERAKAIPADAVVMGTEGRRGLSRLFLGSVTERVIRLSPQPVLSVSPNAPEPPPSDVPFQRILCPVDFSPSSLAALERALDLCGDDGTVTVLHVVEFYIDASIGESVAFDLDEVRERHRSDAVAKLEAAVPEEAKGKARLQTEVLTTHGAWREILDVAEHEQSELVVMGVMGRSKADMLFFGSTTNHVVRSASCPVLTVRASE